MRVKLLYTLVLCVFLTFAAVAYHVQPSVAVVHYRDYVSFMTAFKNLAVEYPSLITYETVGKTVENNDIIMFTVGNPGGERVLIDGGIHGDETLGSEMLYDYAEWLLTSNDSLANRILTNACTLLIPAVNVDNYNTVRVNTHHVDLNRNFATNWQIGGDTNSSSWNYRGPSPLSEPESQTMINVFKTYKPSFYVNLHSFGGSYYLRSSYGNQTYYASLAKEINSTSQNRGVAPYPYYNTDGPGFAISDAAKLGITSFLLELSTNTSLTLSDIQTQILPKFIPIAAVLSAPAFLPWDLNQDGKVDGKDIAIVALAFGSVPGSLNWNPLADLNADGKIDGADIYIVASYFGEQ